MRIAFVVPAYNYAQYLSEGLSSILIQLLPQDEVIVVDDGSTDDTKNVVAVFQQQYPVQLHYFYQHNQGQAVARNFGVAQTTADFVIPIDADDVLLPEVVPKLHAALTSAPHIDFWVAGHESLFPDGRKKLSVMPSLGQKREKNFVLHLKRKISIRQGAMMIRRTVFDRFQYPKEVLGAEDTVVIAHILANYSTASVSFPMMTFRKHEDSFRHQISRQFGRERVCDLIFDPNKLPKVFLKYRTNYEAEYHLECSRIAYFSKQYAETRRHYLIAVRKNFWVLFQSGYFFKFLRSLFK